MRVIELDAAGWGNVLDFYEALLGSLGAPPEHGKSIDALIDSMIWGGINAVEPPYTVNIRHVARAPKHVTEEIELAKQELAAARTYFRAQKGRDVDIHLETTP